MVEFKTSIALNKENIIKHENDRERIKCEIEKLENNHEQHREHFEEMLQQLKEDIERVNKDLKLCRQENDKLEYEGEENIKDLNRSKQ